MKYKTYNIIKLTSSLMLKICVEIIKKIIKKIIKMYCNNKTKNEYNILIYILLKYKIT